MSKKINKIITQYGNDKNQVFNMLLDIQEEFNFISDDAIDLLSEKLGVPKVDIIETISFYHFLTQKTTGEYTIYLNDSVSANFAGRKEVAEAFEKEIGIKFNSVTKDEKIGLFDTSCIGMSDQEPSAIINNKIFTNLTPTKVKEIIKNIKANNNIDNLLEAKLGDGKNSNKNIQSMVNSNIHLIKSILSDNYIQGSAIMKIIEMEPDEVINEIENSELRGRGGAGFPTDLKWKFATHSSDKKKYIFCNADEGEPGTFKDRVILTERPELVFEGMVVAGYAIGSDEGILYLRYEYKYMKKYLEEVLITMRKRNLLGKHILGNKNFNFDIKIQLGGGAYVCGEETALLESAEGHRGEPRYKPPFPAVKGYLEKPTVINNVETLASVVKIINHGNYKFKKMGTEESRGTKLLSISGDCEKPGIYEVEWGITVNEMLHLVGAENVQAVQMGGPSGNCIASEEFDREIRYSDIGTGGSVIVIGNHRDLLKDVVLNFTNFFIEESCGSCVPCRNLIVIYRNTLQKVMDGKAVQKDLDNMLEWENVMKMNRCGLGQTSFNPIVTTLKNFPDLYENGLVEESDFIPTFDINKAIIEGCKASNRKPNI
ncbi:MAG: NAD(P)H-dependent oxidoreductase subunit E [Candidatus Marinimicrobia bacterium]|nr:NAD(P)H-dependent oxidoreductase subunit E [Candidatus Neomarinimicrobiota bacterium]